MAAVSDHPDTIDLVLEPIDNGRLANLCGQLDEHLRQIERRLGIEISNRGNLFRLFGAPPAIAAGREDFLKKIEEALNTDSEEARKKRIHVASENSWEARFYEIQKYIYSHI